MRAHIHQEVAESFVQMTQHLINSLCNWYPCLNDSKKFKSLKLL